MALKYIGDGSTLVGVPARDLTDEEEALYGPQFKAREGVELLKTGLYEKTKAGKSATSEGE